jgi:hypothetical protein
VCDFNGKWLKNFDVFWCASILLRDVEGRTIGYHIKYVAPSHGVKRHTW